MVTGTTAPIRNTQLTYPVYVQAGALDTLGDITRTYTTAHRVVVIADETVAALYGAQVRAAFAGTVIDMLTIPPGEQEKTRERWANLTDELFALGAARDTTIVALGGGVVCDMAGFVAATYMRGIPVLQVPTSLLAMVDASVGGKTAVDTKAGKNLVGAFHDPCAVVIDPNVLASLPPREIRCGLAEIIKHGVIADTRYFEETLRALPEIHAGKFPMQALHDLIVGSVRIKASVVSEDTREHGLRQILNFGHTIGHALERLAQYRVGHGFAVAVGMVAEAEIAELARIAKPGLRRAIVDALKRAQLPTTVAELAVEAPELAGATAESIVDATRTDKKGRSGTTRYALPRQIGEMDPAQGQWAVAIPNDQAAQAVAAVLH